MKIKLIVLCLIMAFLGIFYYWSIKNAYNKGYRQHALEVAESVSEVVVGSYSDILNAAQAVKEKEKEIKYDEVCSVIWDFDLRKCLQ
jgi:hypothetical protein